MASSGGGFGDDARAAGDECLHPGDPHQVGWIWAGGQGAVRLNLPGGQCCFQPRGLCHGSPLARVRGREWLPEHVRRGELFEPAKAGDHALRLGDLKGGWPLSHWLSSAGANLQSVVQLRYIPTECDSRSVCGDIQRVDHLAVNIWGVGKSVRGRRPGRAAVALDQMPRP
jgi:hypothetical protein